MISQATPAHVGTTMTLGVHNIAFFFVLALQTCKNTLTPPLIFGIAKKDVGTHSQ